MPKTPSPELFKLIKSLSKREKIYFKTHLKAAERGVPVYLRLFDFIDNQKQSDDGKILARFKEFNIQRLSAQKKYLQERILEQASYLNGGFIKTISDLLVKADVLYDKCLYKQSMAFVTKAKSIAVKFELFPELLSILNFERKLIVNVTPDAALLEKKYKISYNEKEVVLKNISDIDTCQKLNDKIFIFHYTQSRVRDVEKQKMLNKFLDDPLIKRSPNGLSLRAKELLFAAKGVLFQTINDNANCYKWFKEKLRVTELLSQKGLFFKENYIKTLNNLMLPCLFTRKYKEARQTLEKLKQVKAMEKTLDGLKYDYIYTNTIFLHLATFQYKKVTLLDNEIESAFTRFGDIISNRRKAVIWFYLAFAFFCENDLGRSRKVCQKIINNINILEARDFVSAARILLLIIYYESVELTFMQSLVRNTYRFFKKSEQLYKTEKLMLAFMKKDIYSINSLEGEKRAFLTLKDRLDEIIKDPLEQNFLRIFDVLSWINSKVKGISLAEVMKNKK